MVSTMKIKDNEKIAKNNEDKNISKSKNIDDEAKNSDDTLELVLTEDKDNEFLIKTYIS